MSAANMPDPAESSTECWCCGKPYPADDLLHLESRREAVVCLGCAHYLARRARERTGARRRRELPVLGRIFRITHRRR